MNLLDRIQKKNILVIGDVMLDTYCTGEVRRISPEAPVPVFRKLGGRSSPGGAANVAANLAAANQSVSLLSAIGKDAAGERLKAHLSQLGIDAGMLLPLKACTTEKTRFIAENNQQVLRLDSEVLEEVDGKVCARLLKVLTERIDGADVVVLSDYGKGLLTEEFTQGVIKLAKEHGKRTLADVKGNNAAKYTGAFLVKPNLAELRAMTGLPAGTDEQILAASDALRDACRCEYVLTTCGGRGMVLAGGEEPVFIDADDHEVFDVTGAGDTALAYLAAALANGFSLRGAVEVSNHAAGLQVTKAGTAAIGLREVSEAISRMEENWAGKVLDRRSVSKLRGLSPEKKIVFTNGCFDILHVGHIRCLRQAAALGDMLIVGLNSDESARRLKGEGRPVNTADDRAELLASLAFVDYVVVFDEDTPYELIRQIQPDVLVKGGDYAPEDVAGRDIVEARGGRLVLTDLVEDRSTTGIIRRIRDGEDDV